MTETSRPDLPGVNPDSEEAILMNVLNQLPPLQLQAFADIFSPNPDREAIMTVLQMGMSEEEVEATNDINYATQLLFEGEIDFENWQDNFKKIINATYGTDL